MEARKAQRPSGLVSGGRETICCSQEGEVSSPGLGARKEIRALEREALAGRGAGGWWSRFDPS